MTHIFRLICFWKNKDKDAQTEREKWLNASLRNNSLVFISSKNCSQILAAFIKQTAFQFNLSSLDEDIKSSVCSLTLRFRSYITDSVVDGERGRDQAQLDLAALDLIWTLDHRSQSEKDTEMVKPAIAACKDGAYITCKSTGGQFVIVHSTRVGWLWIVKTKQED